MLNAQDANPLESDENEKRVIREIQALSRTSPADGSAFQVYENEEGGWEIIYNGKTMLSDVYAYDCSEMMRETRMEWIADALNSFSDMPNNQHEERGDGQQHS